AMLPLSAFLVLVAAHGAASAQSVHCDGVVTASARAPNGANFDPPRHYDTEKLARSRAVTAWQKVVAARCLRHSPSWGRAHDKKMECDGYAGGIGCQASARPSRKPSRGGPPHPLLSGRLKHVF